MRRPLLTVWPPLPPGVHLRRPRSALPFPLDREHRLYARGRHALWNGVRALALPAGSEILVPAYHHGSEVEALARAGLACRFYEGTARLEPDADELEGLLGPAVQALYLIHYLGFPQDSANWRAWCESRGLLLFEDVAQGWLGVAGGRPLGSHGHLALYCLYKTFGLPDGGALVAEQVGEAPAGRAGSGVGALGRRHAAWLAGRSGWAASAAEALHREGVYDPAEDFALGDPSLGPARTTLALLPRVVDESAAARRRANYLALLDELGELVPPPFDGLPDGAAPFAFPLTSEDMPPLLAELRRHGVDGRRFWSTPHPLLAAGGFPAAARRRATTVALPVHQELRPEDLELIAAAALGPRRPRRAELVLEPVSALEDLREEWTELAEETRNVFATWEWASTWRRHFAADRPLQALACRSGGRLVAVLPLYEWRSQPLRVVRLLGHGAGDQLGPICRSADRAQVAKAFRRAASELDADVVLAENVAADEGWSALLGGRVLRRSSSPVLTLRDGSAGSPRLRKRLRYEERRLARDNRLAYRLAGESDRLEDDLDALFALHRARWPDESSAFAPQEPFQRDFARVACERGWLRLWFLDLDGAPAAAWYGFRFGGAEAHYQGGRDPRWEPHSLGLLLLAHTIEEARADGLDEYRFLRGGEAYKHRFATRDPGLETVGLARGAAGALALAGWRALDATRGVGGRLDRAAATTTRPGG